MKYEEIKNIDRKTLEGKLAGLRRELFELKVEKHIKKQAGGLPNSHVLKLKRRDVARILTALREIE